MIGVFIEPELGPDVGLYVVLVAVLMLKGDCKPAMMCTTLAESETSVGSTATTQPRSEVGILTWS